MRTKNVPCLLPVIGGLAVFTASCGNNKTESSSQASDSKPNIIILFADDMGYADLNCYGATGYATPNLDRMAGEGMRFTDFYVPAPSSAPSRNALLTGSYPARNYTNYQMPDDSMTNLTPIADVATENMPQEEKRYADSLKQFVPDAQYARHPCGLADSELTLAEMLRNAGYATVMYGKWHLGETMRDHPLRHGFDEYWGVTASVSVRPDFKDPYASENNIFYPMQALFDNDSIVGYNVDYSLLTKQYTEKAIEFIGRKRDKPFFMFLSYAMPHVPIGASSRFKGRTQRGLYGDVIEEIDWSAGAILQELEKQGIAKNTLVIFTSDNGPWLSYGDHAGSALPLREGKGTRFEGGVRVPCIMRWPGHIPSGSVCRSPAMTIDLMPTFAELSGAQLPAYALDGKSIAPLLKNPDTPPVQDFYLFYNIGNLPGKADSKVLAVRSGKWKLILPHNYHTLNGKPGGTNGNPATMETAQIDTCLFDLSVDASETINLKEQHPDIVRELCKKAAEYDRKLKSEQRALFWLSKD